MEEKQKRFTRKEWGWIMYDWANSVYATNIMAAIFPTIFVSMAGAGGDASWSLATSVATFVVALLAPILGAAADFKGMKKKLFTGFMLLGVVATALLAFTDNWKLLMVFYIFSRIGFSGSCLFYDSFLTDVTTDDRMDKVSSWGYAMGYIGGSTIPFVISIAVLMVLGYSSPVAQKFSILITSVWWLAFSVPFFKNVQQEHYIERTGEHSIKQTFRNIWHTAKDIMKTKGLFLFVVAYFFYIDGVGTIISISTAYGTILGLGATGMIIALMVTQIVAVPCSIWFSRLSQKISARKALSGAILVYIVICIVGFYMGFSLEPHQQKYEDALDSEIAFLQIAAEDEKETRDAYAKYITAWKEGKTAELVTSSAELDAQILAFVDQNKDVIDAYQQAISFSATLFWMMAVLVGTVQGGIQAVSRSYFGKIVPKDRSNEYFGFFDIFGKFAAVLGPVLYAAIASWTGRSSYGVISLIILFLIGFVILQVGHKELDAIEGR